MDGGQLRRDFERLAAISSPSGHEHRVRQVMVDELSALGFACEIDDVGNVFGRRGSESVAWAINAHMDTVEPAGPVKVLENDGWYRSDGTTILGADDKAGLAIVLHLARLAASAEASGQGLEVLLTVGEEEALYGAHHAEISKLDADFVLCLDGSGGPDNIVVGSPGMGWWDAHIEGRAAHAGVDPEAGRSAILAAAEALDRLPWGRVADDATANVGKFIADAGRNVVPDSARLAGEVRSHRSEATTHMLNEIETVFQRVAYNHECSVAVDTSVVFEPYRLDPASPALRAAAKAIAAVGLQPTHVVRGGGTDANVLNAAGKIAFNIGTGY